MTVGRKRPRHPLLALFIAGASSVVASPARLVMTPLAALGWLVARYCVWRSLLAGGAVFADYDWPRIRSYVVLAFGVNSLLSGMSSSRLQSSVRTGDVVVDLVRPVAPQAATCAWIAGATAV